MSSHAQIPSILRGLSIAVLVNFAAGGGRARTYLPRIRRLFESAQMAAEFVLTKSAEDLEARALDAILDKYQVLVVMGGDGTFQVLANAACEADVLLGVLPVGGGNDFSAALGFPSDPVKAAEVLLQGQERRVDLVRARAANGQERLYAGGGGVGLDAEAARFANRGYRHLPGRSRYIAAALRALASYEPVEVKLDFPGSDLSSIRSKALLAGVLNTPTYGAGVRLAPEAAIDDGSLDVVVIEDLSFMGVLALLPRLMGSGELRTSRVRRCQAQRVRLSTDRPCLFHGDGEILGPTPVEIEVVPRGIRVLAAARC
ncbi:MAG TPA: diacylglycerol kinase family protein [Candidatus Acidoferrum sp.]|nr:diacylglycerol kinase family protein [Candidatus Acidoferrum sp.]